MDWSSLTPAVVLALGSLATACCSFFVALFNYRRSNYSVVRVVTSDYRYCAEVGRGDYHEFRIVIQNLGIPLHNIGMCLEYSEADGFGRCTFPMKTKDGKGIREGQFAKGAITEFTFTTDRMHEGDDDFIRRMTDLKAQRVQFILHADKYEMWSYRLHDRLWWLKRRWNWVAHWLTWRMRREVTTTRGTKGIKYLICMPEFGSPGQNLFHFAEEVRKAPPRIQRPGWRFPTGPKMA